MKKLRFLLVVPVAALAWTGAAVLGPAPSLAATPPTTHPVAKAQGRIGTITWRGNKFVSAARLNEALGLKTGDPYSKEQVETKLNYRPDNTDVGSLYMDHGYLFFQVTQSATARPDGTTDLVLSIDEGPVAHVNSVMVKGNQKVATADVLALIPLHKGELFSRAKLIQSQRVLAESGFFDPTKIGINPQPDVANGLVNIEYVLIEK
jgi:outer membrane protein assembly factor BamA